jgi:hypothetical protein
VKPSTVTLALVIGVNEERPDGPGRCIANREGHDRALTLDDPTTSCLFDRFADGIVADRGRDKPVFAHGMADSLYVRHVGEGCLA